VAGGRGADLGVIERLDELAILGLTVLAGGVAAVEE
jgi:hypothetical protein